MYRFLKPMRSSRRCRRRICPPLATLVVVDSLQKIWWQDFGRRNLCRSTRRERQEVVLLVTLFFVYAGDLPPMVNEAHYLVKAKNFWEPEWCGQDLFAASAKVHFVFSATFGLLHR